MGEAFNEAFERDLKWQEALLRVQERRPELCEAVAELAAEYGLFEHPKDFEAQRVAVNRALRDERYRALVDFGHALIIVSSEVAAELRGDYEKAAMWRARQEEDHERRGEDRLEAHLIGGPRESENGEEGSGDLSGSGEETPTSRAGGLRSDPGNPEEAIYAGCWVRGLGNLRRLE